MLQKLVARGLVLYEPQTSIGNHVLNKPRVQVVNSVKLHLSSALDD